MKERVAEKVKELEAYALANYDKGGDEVYEIFEFKDYAKVIEASRSMRDAKSDLKRKWTLYTSIRKDRSTMCEY
jgi:hypothetical protein